MQQAPAIHVHQCLKHVLQIAFGVQPSRQRACKHILQQLMCHEPSMIITCRVRAGSSMTDHRDRYTPAITESSSAHMIHLHVSPHAHKCTTSERMMLQQAHITCRITAKRPVHNMLPVDALQGLLSSHAIFAQSPPIPIPDEYCCFWQRMT
jgi:hypothetical protein